MAQQQQPEELTATLSRVVTSPGSAAHLEQRKVRLEVLGGPDRGAAAELTGEHLVVGTHPRCGLVLSDPTVSRHHLELRVSAGKLVLVDLGSTNGTAVNGVRVREAWLPDRAQVTIGGTRIEIASQQEVVTQALSAAGSFGELVGMAPPMRALFAKLERAAAADIAVLVEGETGTGKELAARALHDCSARAQGPFVVVDCGVLPPALIEGELFGHARGAFTGAERSRQGAFEQAHGGTLFLDEIGELALELQPRLLRALEQKEVKRIGSNRVISIDVRVVAATNRNLRQMVAEGNFRDDLYYRLAVLQVTIPPLRERLEDIPRLVHRFLEEHPGEGFFVSDELLTRLQSRSWPGNVRELRNVIERALSFGLPAAAAPDAASTEAETTRALRGAMAPLVASRYKEARARLLEVFEWSYLTALLERCEGNLTRSAREAGIDRVYLLRLLDKYDLR